MKELGPILRMMFHNRVGTTLVALQIAITIAILMNSLAWIGSLVSDISKPSGIDEANIFSVSSLSLNTDFDARAAVEEDLMLIRSLPGVVAAKQTNAIPFSQSGWSSSLQAVPGYEANTVLVALYMVDETALDVFGSNLMYGEMFNEIDVTWNNDRGPKTVITRATAEALFPDVPMSQIPGKVLYHNNDVPQTIIGVVDLLISPWPNANFGQIGYRSQLVAEKRARHTTTYLIRTEPGRRDELMLTVQDQLSNSNRNRVIDAVRTMEDHRSRGYLGTHLFATILSTVLGVLLLITTAGIVGLMTFTVKKRTREIGTRRALGATKIDILRACFIEMLLIALMGAILGIVLAVLLSLVLVNAGVPKIDFLDWAIGLVGLFALVALAVWGPAYQASSIAPAVATRTV